MIQAIVWAFVFTSGAGMSLGADEDGDLGRVPARQALELLERQLLGVDDHAALAAAVRDGDDCALPGHPHRERLDLVEAHVLVIPDAALGRAAAQVVLNPEAGEDLDAAIVHVDGEMDRQLAARLTQDAAQARVELEAVGGEIELLLRDMPGVDVRSNLLCCHGEGNLRIQASRKGGRLPSESSPGRLHGTRRGVGRGIALQSRRHASSKPAASIARGSPTAWTARRSDPARPEGPARAAESAGASC